MKQKWSNSQVNCCICKDIIERTLMRLILSENPLGSECSRTTTSSELLFHLLRSLSYVLCGSVEHVLDFFDFEPPFSFVRGDLPPGCSTHRLCHYRKVLLLIVTRELKSVPGIYVCIQKSASRATYSLEDEVVSRWGGSNRARVEPRFLMEYFNPAEWIVFRFGIY